MKYEKANSIATDFLQETKTVGSKCKNIFQDPKKIHANQD